MNPKPDFSGWATKAGLRCSDGRTIMPHAFQHQDKVKVPLVWQHGHGKPENVLGHAILENRDEGVYTYAYFNTTPQGQHAKTLVQHGDINSLSIYANQLVEKGKQVIHGMIREVSLVLAGANPGAVIDNVVVAHGDMDREIEDEAVIYTGETLRHGDGDSEESDKSVETPENAAGDPVEGEEEAQGGEGGTSNEGDAGSEGGEAEHADNGGDATIQDIYDTMTEEQQQVVHYMLGAALEAAAADNNPAQHSDIEGDGEMRRNNVFESNSSKETDGPTLSHDDIKGIVESARKSGSLKEAVHSYALQHGIDNIDYLFPDAKDVNGMPEWQSRRVEWVAGVLNGTRHTPFSRIKSRQADITMPEARAKGYIKGNMKKEEFFGVAGRVTTPTTIYKKQSLDRDDVLDITDFDVVAWMKGEMRLMLEEEIARAILIGDGRDVGDEDKIKDPSGAAEGQGIRSILNDHEMYVTNIHVNVDDANSTYVEVIENVARARRHYKGTGNPTFYTTASVHTELLLVKDSLGRRLYDDDTALAAALRVSNIVDVEVMEDLSATLLGIIVNLGDYVIGSDKGGEVNLFDDFDIDYNKLKYLIETRLSGALVKLKSAVVIRRAAASDTVVVANAPTFNPTTGVVTIVATTGVTYKDANGNTLTTGAQTALDEGDSIEVHAVAASGKYLSDEDDYVWTFQRPRA